MDGDRISGLPDDILISIISRITTREALRTIALSRRWAHLFRFVSAVNLCQRGSRSANVYTPSDSDARIDEVHRVLQRHYSYIRFFEFHISFLNKEKQQQQQEARFEQCIYSLGELRIQKLILRADHKLILRADQKLILRADDSFPFPFHLLTTMPSLNYLKLYSFCLLPCLGFPCHSLKTLKLYGVDGLPGSLECILASCIGLCSLSIVHCELPSKLCFSGGHDLRMEVLCIHALRDVKEIEFFAHNLVTFEFDGSDIVDFIFDCVPKLHNVYLSFWSNQAMPYVCRRLVKDVPHIKTLLLDRMNDFYEEGASILLGINKFNNLKRLEFTVGYVCWFNLFSVIQLVHSCPLLQELYLVATGRQYGWPDVEGDVIIHPQLKNVEISGFGGSTNEINFALYILRSAVRLQLMNISWYHCMYIGFGEWVELDYPPVTGKEFSEVNQRFEQLKEQAASTTVQVVFQKFSKEVSEQF